MKLILLYTLAAGVVSAVTAPIPGTSLLLTALEIYMLVHLAKVNEYKLGFKEIGESTAKTPLLPRRREEREGISMIAKKNKRNPKNFFNFLNFFLSGLYPFGH